MRAIFFIFEEVIHTVSEFDSFQILTSTIAVSAESPLSVIINSNTLPSSSPFHLKKTASAWDFLNRLNCPINQQFTQPLHRFCFYEPRTFLYTIGFMSPILLPVSLSKLKKKTRATGTCISMTCPSSGPPSLSYHSNNSSVKHFRWKTWVNPPKFLGSQSLEIDNSKLCLYLKRDRLRTFSIPTTWRSSNLSQLLLSQ